MTQQGELLTFNLLKLNFLFIVLLMNATWVSLKLAIRA